MEKTKHHILWGILGFFLSFDLVSKMERTGISQKAHNLRQSSNVQKCAQIFFGGERKQDFQWFGTLVSKPGLTATLKNTKHVQSWTAADKARSGNWCCKKELEIEYGWGSSNAPASTWFKLSHSLILGAAPTSGSASVAVCICLLQGVTWENEVEMDVFLKMLGSQLRSGYSVLHA